MRMRACLWSMRSMPIFMGSRHRRMDSRFKSTATPAAPRLATMAIWVSAVTSPHLSSRPMSYPFWRWITSCAAAPAKRKP